MTKLQFRVLYRQFLFRMVDLELLSPAAQGDIHTLLGRFAALLLFLSLWLSGLPLAGGNAAAAMGPVLGQIALWAVEHFLIATTMLAVGLFAVISWDSMFPDRRDVLVLSPLPIRARTLFLAKAAAVGAALGLTVGVVNVFTSLTSPLLVPAGGAIPRLRMFGVYWITMLAAGAFNFGLVLTIQGLAQLLPRQKFLRVSATLQIAAFFLFLSMYFLQLPFASPAEMLSTQNRRLMPWLPSYWFLAFFQQLNGLPMPEALAGLARRAWIGLDAAVGGSLASYLICYFRTLRKIAEQPDILPGSSGLHWLPSFGGSLATAIVQFSIRTLFRSRRHRVTLSFYLGIAFAIMLLMAKDPKLAGVRWHEANLQTIAGSVLVMCSAVLGIRVAFSMPIDLRANWIFRVMPVRGGSGTRAAVRLTLFTLAVAPVWLIAAAVLFRMWPWRQAAGHLAMLGLLGIVVAETCLESYRKIPFTCSYLPGKTHFHIAVIIYVMFALELGTGAEMEQAALLGDHRNLAIMLTIFAIAAGLLRWPPVWLGSRPADSLEEEIEFEDVPAPVVMSLGLNRDGTFPV